MDSRAAGRPAARGAAAGDGLRAHLDRWLLGYLWSIWRRMSTVEQELS